MTRTEELRQKIARLRREYESIISEPHHTVVFYRYWVYDDTKLNGVYGTTEMLSLKDIDTGRVLISIPRISKKPNKKNLKDRVLDEDITFFDDKVYDQYEVPTHLWISYWNKKKKEVSI